MSYKLRDGAGQAREFNNYMLPVDMGEGVPYFCWACVKRQRSHFAICECPLTLRAAWTSYAASLCLTGAGLARKGGQALRRQGCGCQECGIDATVGGILIASAGIVVGIGAPRRGRACGGLQAVADFIEANVPESERNKAGEVLIRILNGTLFELAQIAREGAGLPPMPADEKTQCFMTQAVLALSDAPLYPAPVMLQLSDFTQVQASVFQVARAPGKTVVYLGCALLILGVFAMLYVRERRLWIWFGPVVGGEPNAVPRAHATMALSTNRKTMDGDREFDQLKARLLGVTD